MSFGPMSSDIASADTTLDAVLGGRLKLRQPRRGHRVGHDGILLAAATGGAYGERAVEFGAGVGAAGLALASRNPGMRVTLVEVDPALCALARDNARSNGFAERVSVLARDVTMPDLFGVDALSPGDFDRVLMNPPFNDPERQHVSPDAARALAHAAPADMLARWVAAAERALAPRGVLTMIWRADGLAQVLDALGREFGNVAILPVHPRPGAPAIRLLIRAGKAGRAPLALLPGLELNDAGGRPSAAAEEVLRKGGLLPLAGL
jgi:tRNA1(Val) A37 N6-methylase TrmN6